MHLAYVNGTNTFYEKPTAILDIAVRGMVNVIQSCVDNKVPELFFSGDGPPAHSEEEAPVREESFYPDYPDVSLGSVEVILCEDWVRSLGESLSPDVAQSAEELLSEGHSPFRTRSAAELSRNGVLESFAARFQGVKDCFPVYSRAQE